MRKNRDVCTANPDARRRGSPDTSRMTEQRAGYTRILVAVDGSRESSAALEEAVRLARASHARLDLLAVVSMRSAATWAASSQPVDVVERLFADVKDVSPALFDGLSATAFLAEGDPGAAIVAHAAAHGNDLIVMGCRSRIGPVPLPTPSTTSAVMRNVHVPVLVVRRIDEDHGSALWPTSLAEAGARDVESAKDAALCGSDA